jgi:hypothetical protein
MDKYYVRVRSEDASKFEFHLTFHGMEFTHLSNDFGKTGGTSLYAVPMDGETALSLKLSFPLLGCMNFQSTMAKLKK